MIALLAAAAFALPVDVSRVRAPYARLPLPVAVDPGPYGNYGDVRVYDDRGREVPYALDARGGPGPQVTVASSDFVVRDDAAPGEQRVVLDAGTAHADVVEAVLGSATEAFARDVVLERSDDGATWSVVEKARAERFPDGSARLALSAHGERARYWRVSVDDGDDAPLAALHVRLVARSHAIVFPVRPGRRYTVTFGDPEAIAPVYDLEEILRNDPRRAETVSPGRIVELPRHGGAGARDAPDAERRARVPSATATERRDDFTRRLPALAFGIAVSVLARFALRLIASRR